MNISRMLEELHALKITPPADKLPDKTNSCVSIPDRGTEKLKEVWREFKETGNIAHLKQYEMSDVTLESLFHIEDKEINRILTDGAFISALDDFLCSKLLRKIKRHFIQTLIANKVDKKKIQDYLVSLYEASMRGTLDNNMVTQLRSLALVPYLEDTSESLIVPWHHTVFYLTFKHDPLEERICLGY